MVKSGFLVFLFIGHCLATTFIPISFERQIKDSDAIIQGTYVTQFSKKLADGNIATEFLFDVEKSQGLKNSELRGYTNFKVLSLGGDWQGETYKVHGAPRFKKNESVILFLKKDKHGYWIQNLSLGKYKLKQVGTEVLMISSVFPYHPQMGQIKVEDFYSKVEKIKVVTLVDYNPDYSKAGYHLRKPATNSFESHHVTIKKNDKKEASKTHRVPNSLPKEEMNIWWLIVLFALMGGISSILIKKSS